MLEYIIGKFANAIADRVWKLIATRFDQALAYNKIYEKHDAKKNEMIEELLQADTEEERDAILTKIYNSRPTFE